LVKTKNLKLQTIKVKAHCGILGNELADSLAKEGSISTDPSLEVDNNETGSIRFNPVWQSHSIEQKLRKFISNNNSIYHQISWSINSNIRNY